MSTKIYYAYKYDGTIHDLMKILFKIRMKYWKNCREELKKWGGFTAKKFLEHEGIAKHLLPYHKSSLEELENKYDGKYRDKPIYELSYCDIDYILQTYIRSGYNELLNFQASIVVYTHKENIYVQFFGVRGVKKYINKKFSDFHYQNQTDRDEKISDEEWKNREKVWDYIFKVTDKPSMSGLAFPLFELENCWDFCYWYWNKENPQNEK